MKTGARFLAMLLAVVMIASAALSVSAFEDIAGNKHADAINVLSQLGIVGGYEDGSFKPDQKVTRAEMAKLVYVLYTTFIDAGAAKTEFTDVAANHWATGYINWCSGKEIIGGFGDGTFAPNANVTYDQALKMVAGALGYTNWDSKLWPTDVRMVALNDLKLGTDLEGVNGSAELTRGQVAQVIYNALGAPMAEKKVENVEIAGGIIIPVEVVKTFKNDVWKFAEETAIVTGTENYVIAGDGNEKAAEGKINLDGEDVALEDLGLTEFEGKTDALIGLTVTKVTRNGELLAAATISGSVVDGVKVEVSKDAKTLTIAGVDYKYDAEEIPALWTLDASITNDAVFTGEVVADAVKNVVAAPYVARAIDTDGDGDVDAIVLAAKAIYTALDIVEVTEDDVKVKYVKYGAGANDKFAVTAMTATVAEGDVFVAAVIDNIVYTEVVKPVEATATKLNANTVTLDTVGAVAHGATGIANVTLEASALGVKQNYWIYNGEIILADTISGPTFDYNFAILKEVVKGDKVFNEETKIYEVGYKAIIIVDGKETEVVLDKIVNADETVADKAAWIIAENAETPIYNYAVLASFVEGENGYVLTLDKEADDVTLVTTGKIEYNKAIDLFKVGDKTKVVLADTTNIYYTFTKEESGEYKYIGRYTEANVPTADIFEADITKAYVEANEDGTYTLLFALVSNVKTESDETVDPTTKYLTDGRLVVYAPYASSVVYDAEAKKNYNEYIFMDLATLKNKDAVVDKTLVATEAKATVGGNLYAWNGQKYVDIDSNTADLESVKVVALTDVLAARNLVDIDGATTKIADSVIIWGLSSADSNGIYSEYTLADIAAMDELNGDAAVEALVFTYVDEAENTVISSIIINVIAADEEGVAYNVNEAIFNNFVVEAI